jgi:hypothetical protein
MAVVYRVIAQQRVYVTLKAIKLWSPIGLRDAMDLALLDNWITDGGKVISPTHRPHFTP